MTGRHPLTLQEAGARLQDARHLFILNLFGSGPDSSAVRDEIDDLEELIERLRK